MDASADSVLSPSFLNLPLEIRWHIYSYLLGPPDDWDSVDAAASHDYDPNNHEKTKLRPSSHYVLRMRHSPLTPKMKLRTQYKTRSGRLRFECQDACYRCVNAPFLHTAILGVNKQIHREAAEVLYSRYIFDFDLHIEAVAPFIKDLTPVSRSFVRRISVVKRALPYDKDFDRCEWLWMCRCLADDTSLEQLYLGVTAGKPAIGWDGIRKFSPEDFNVITRLDEMKWVDHVALIQGLRTIEVRACVEHSPPPVSSSLEFFIAFSASVEPSFASYLSGRLIPSVA